MRIFFFFQAEDGIRDVAVTGVQTCALPISTGAVVRGLFRLVDCYLPILPFLPGLVLIFLQRRNQRLGDLVAGTIVVRDRPMDWGLGPAPAADQPLDAGPPELSDDEFRLLDQFLARAGGLAPAIQT